MNNDSTVKDGADPMERAEETPDVAVLQHELQNAWDRDANTYNQTAWKEGIRYARWHGQTADGMKHREHMGARAMPYDGAPDSRIMLADGITNDWVDILFAAFFGARVKTAPTSAKTLTVAQAAEWRALISWMLHGPLRASLIDDVEFTAQTMLTIGWCVLHPNWRKEKVLKMERLTMDEIMEVAKQAEQMKAQKQQANIQQPTSNNQQPMQGGQGKGQQPMQGGQGATLLAQAPAMILNPEMEEAAMELLMMFFPDMDKRQARRTVRELRTDGEAEFPIEVDGPNVPELRVLVPGQHFIMPVESSALPGRERWMAVREFMSEQGLRERAQQEDWNEAFVERVVKTKGLSIAEDSVEHTVDEDMRDIEMFYMYQLRNNENGVPGLFCTAFSMFVGAEGGKEATEADYGYHALVEFAHKQQPFVIQQTEVTGLRPMDARGIPEIVMTQQNEMKNSRDLTYIYQQLSVAPPLQKTGIQASKLPPGLSPMGIVQNVTGGEWKWFPPPPGNPEIAFKLMETVRKEVEDYFGLARPDSVPQKAASRQARWVMRWLAKWAECLWQLSILAYQNLSPEELQGILGRAPLLNAEMLVNQQLMLWFEVRSMDSNWLDDMIDNAIKLLQVDRGGVMDTNKLVQFILAYMDPTLGEEVTMDQAGAKQQVFKEVRDEINSIMQGNKPMLRENDPTAKMKMMFAQQVLQDNPDFMLQVTEKLGNVPNPHFNPQRAEALKTYTDNLQHNFQEMVLSKQQGALGVRAVGRGPVAQGAK